MLPGRDRHALLGYRGRGVEMLLFFYTRRAREAVIGTVRGTGRSVDDEFAEYLNETAARRERSIMRLAVKTLARRRAYTGKSRIAPLFSELRRFVYLVRIQCM